MTPGQHRDCADPAGRAVARLVAGHVLAVWEALRHPRAAGLRDVELAVAAVLGTVLALVGVGVLLYLHTAQAVPDTSIRAPRPTVTVTYPVWQLPAGWPTNLPSARPGEVAKAR